MERGGEILELTAGDVMTRDPVSVPRVTLAAEALNIMEQRKITSIVVAEDGDADARGRRRCTCTICGGWRCSRTELDLAADSTALRQNLECRKTGVTTEQPIADPVRRRRRADRRHDAAARRRQREQGVRHQGRHRHRVGAAARADRRFPVGAFVGGHGAARRAARDHARASGRRRASSRPTSRSPTSLMLDDEQVAYMGDDILDLPVLAARRPGGGAGRRGGRCPAAASTG